MKGRVAVVIGEVETRHPDGAGVHDLCWDETRMQMVLKQVADQHGVGAKVEVEGVRKAVGDGSEKEEVELFGVTKLPQPNSVAASAVRR